MFNITFHEYLLNLFCSGRNDVHVAVDKTWPGPDHALDSEAELLATQDADLIC